MPKPRCLILTVTSDTSEMEELVYSLGYDTAGVVFQNRGRPDPQFFLGRGKLGDARDVARELGVDLVVVNENLKPNQIFNITDFLNAAGSVDDGHGSGAPSVAADAGLDLSLVASDDAGAARGSRGEGGGARGDAGASRGEAGSARGAGGAARGDATRSADAAGEGGADETTGRSRAGGGRSGSGTRQRARRQGERIEVFDRLRVILEIFTERARSPEARLQVDLAKLQYEMPIVKEYIHLAKKGEHPGFLAGGEYEVNQYYSMMNTRIAKIRRDLDRISREREVRRKHRRKSGFHLVSLAGYTNAGKSSLLRALSSAGGDILVENRYFSTLATRTRRAESGKRDILVTDTVGFIEDLPPWLIEAFHSTLEEIALADVILLVADASDPLDELERKVRTSLTTLWEFDGRAARAAIGRGAAAAAANAPAPHLGRASPDLGRASAAKGDSMAGARGRAAPTPAVATVAAVGAVDAGDDAGARAVDGSGAGAPTSSIGAPAPSADAAASAPPAADLSRGPGGLAPILVALNKVDVVPPDELAQKVAALQAAGLMGTNWAAVSARSRAGLEELLERLYVVLPRYDEYDLALPPSADSERFVAWVHANGDVLDLTRGNETHLHFEASVALREEVERRMAACGATPLREVVRAGDALRAGEEEAATADDPPEGDPGDGAADDGAADDSEGDEGEGGTPRSGGETAGAPPQAADGAAEDEDPKAGDGVERGAAVRAR